MQLFYAPDVANAPVLLPDDEARHCTKVLRKVPGDRILLTDGKGGLWNAKLLDAGKRECLVQPDELLPNPMPRNYSLTMVVAPSKNTERFEWFLEKATEIGVDRIIPLLTDRTERPRLKTERMERILLAAMKQSGRVVLPILDELSNFDNALKLVEDAEQRFIATCFGDDRPHLANVYEKGRNVVIFIGPEGDFTEAEAEKAVSVGFHSVSLGPARLRLETAAVAACHIVNLKNETA